MFNTKQERWLCAAVSAWSLWAVTWGDGWAPVIGWFYLGVTALNWLAYRDWRKAKRVP